MELEHLPNCYCCFVPPRHRKTSVLETLFFRVCRSVSESVSICVPKVSWMIRFWGQKAKGKGHSGQWPENLVNTIIIKYQWREVHPISVTHVFGFIAVLIRFWDQKVKGQSCSRKNRVNAFVTIGANFSKSGHMYLNLETYRLAYWLKGQGHSRRRYNRQRHPVKFYLV